MALDYEFITEYAIKHKFRPQRIAEADDHYMAALIKHVQSFDYAEAYELRIGKRQVDWTHDESRAFGDHMVQEWKAVAEKRPATLKESLDQIDILALAMRILNDCPATDEELIRLAESNLTAFVAHRIEAPTDDIPILVNVLTMDGRLCTTAVSREHRFPVLRLLLGALPAHGFFMTMDMFIHHVDQEKGISSKRDALVVQLATRTQRLMMKRPYTVTNGVAVFDDPPPEHEVLTGLGPDKVEDPYADLLPPL